MLSNKVQGLPWWSSGEESSCQCRGHGFYLWPRKIPHASRQLNLCLQLLKPVWLEACALQQKKAPVQHQRSSAAKDKSKFKNNKYIKTKINHKGTEGNYQFGQKNGNEIFNSRDNRESESGYRKKYEAFYHKRKEGMSREAWRHTRITDVYNNF